MTRTPVHRTRLSRAALAVAASALLTLTACGPTPAPRPTHSSGQTEPVATTQTEQPPTSDGPTVPAGSVGFPAPSAAASDQDVRTAVEGMYQRSTAMVHGTRDERGNAIVSPLSLDVVMGMLREGAGGTTAKELDHYFGGEQQTHLAALQTIASRATSPGERRGDASVELADVMLTRNGKVQVRQDYRDRLVKSYGAQQEGFDRPVEAADKANAWAKDKTHGLVPEVIPRDQVSDDLVMVLANATYFKGVWAEELQTAAPAPFTTAKGEKVQAPMMSLTHELDYAEAPGVKAVRMPYRGGYSMWLVLPDDPKADPAAALAGLPSLKPTWRKVALTMPGFTIEQKQSLNTLVQQLGVSSLFDSKTADLTGIGSAEGVPLYVGQIRQSAKISVDERGTEAAAVTTAEILAGAAPARPDQPVPFRLDRPFAFAIQHDQTDAPLFAGTVGDPTKP